MPKPTEAELYAFASLEQLPIWREDIKPWLEAWLQELRADSDSQVDTTEIRWSQGQRQAITEFLAQVKDARNTLLAKQRLS